jgi:hypothetical protein
LRHLGRQRTVEIPFCPGVRYIPGKPLLRSNVGQGTSDDTDQVPDASRISPPRMDRLHPDAAYLSLQGRLDHEAVLADSITSPTHPIGIRENGRTLDVCLADGAALPDRDFVVRWDEKPVEQLKTRAWTYQQDGHTYALLELKAPEVGPATRAPMDFYFLVDRSGSMQGVKWQKAAQALHTAVRGLGQQDRVMITLFESQHIDFAEKPLARDRVLNDPAFAELARVGTAGGTELVPALRHLLDVWRQHSATRTASLILITDAQVGNERELLKLASTAQGLPIHCFGIDDALNDALLIKLAEQQGGTFHSLKPGDDIVGAVSGIVATVGEPAVRDLTLTEGWESATDRLPNLHPGQTVYLPLRCSAGTTALYVRGQLTSGEVHMFDCATVHSAGRAVQCLWSRNRMERLLREKQPAEAIALSKAANLVCPLTAFVAWDEHEKVVVAQESLVQPVLDSIEVLNQQARDQVPLTAYFRSVGAGQSRKTRSHMNFCLFDSPAPEPGKPSWTGVSDRLAGLLDLLGGFIPMPNRDRWLKRIKELEMRDTLAGRVLLESLRHFLEECEKRATKLHDEWRRLCPAFSARSKALQELSARFDKVASRLPLRDTQLVQTITDLERSAGEFESVHGDLAEMIAQLECISREMEALAGKLEVKLEELLAP